MSTRNGTKRTQKKAQPERRRPTTLSKAIKTQGRSAEWLSQRTGYSRGHIWRVARGDHKGSTRFHAAMQSALGATYQQVDELRPFLSMQMPRFGYWTATDRGDLHTYIGEVKQWRYRDALTGLIRWSITVEWAKATGMYVELPWHVVRGSPSWGNRFDSASFYERHMATRREEERQRRIAYKRAQVFE